MATAVPTYCNEQEKLRHEANWREHWGHGTLYFRFCKIPKGNVDDFLFTDMPLGTIIPDAWIDHSPGTGAGAPMRQHMTRDQENMAMSFMASKG